MSDQHHDPKDSRPRPRARPPQEGGKAKGKGKGKGKGKTQAASAGGFRKEGGKGKGTSDGRFFRDRNKGRGKPKGTAIVGGSRKDGAQGKGASGGRFREEGPTSRGVITSGPTPVPARPVPPVAPVVAGPVEGPAAAIEGTISGTVAILGRPNVGKSTLLNRIVGQKLAIVSPKPQTTRNRILGVWNGAAGQIVFVDTPGVHNARGALHRFMVEEALGVVDGVDAALLVVEPPESSAAVRVNTAERQILEVLKHGNKPVVLAINKVDTVKDKPSLFPILTAWQEIATFSGLVPVSAKKGSGVSGLVGELCKLLPKAPPLYDTDMLTDRTERFLTAELIREQLFLSLRQELPYATAVVVESWEERPDRRDVVIDANIIVERDSQKGIVLGKGGTMLRDIGTRARAEVSALLDRPAHLRLFVKVAPEWTSSPEAVARLGYDR